MKILNYKKMSGEKCVTVSLNSDSTRCVYTGDIVTGTLTLQLRKDCKIDIIELEIIGKSEARWSRTMPTIPYIKIYSETKKVLYIKNTDIFGNYIGKKMTTGVHCYPFHFALPEDLPSTFKSALAKVEYCIKITSKPKNVVRKIVPFTVVGTVNINNVDEMLAPCIYQYNRIFKRIAGKVTVHLRTYKSIAPRQTIPFEIIINNEKNITISAIHLILVQKVHYTVSSGYANQEKIISKVTPQDVGKSISDLCRFSMEIPQIIPSSIHLTEPMIDISYLFRLQVRFPFHLNLCEDMPVTVASVPVIHYDF